MLPLLFFGAFFLYVERDVTGASMFFAAVVVIPFLAFTDRIVFDGKRLRRTGILPRFWAWFNNFHYRLKVSDIEQIETQSRRALKRGGNVFYRYRTSFTGRGLQFVIASGGEEYRRMSREIFSRVSTDILDNRSIELRDYLAEPKEALMKAEFAHIPSADVLEASVRDYRVVRAAKNGRRVEGDPGRALELRKLGNELRLSGYLIQALEAFRRALLITPADNWLLFEFARCLNSYASAERDERMLRRALATLKLVEKRAVADGELLARVGESYFQFGDWQRAQTAFQKSVEVIEASFRAARGMAEIALREGKIAHVIHNFLTANRLAETPALRRWTQSEADYFSRLNDNEEYMDLEISRINLLETLERSKRTAMRVAMVGFPTILVGLVFEDSLVANIGWAVSSIALVLWFALIIGVNVFSSRIPYEALEEE
jgi:tetratricopeptide (TPR) repeat protein